MKTYTEEEVKRIEDILHEEIIRKDEIIKELKKNNKILLNTALKKVNTELEKNELKNSANKITNEQSHTSNKEFN